MSDIGHWPGQRAVGRCWQWEAKTSKLLFLSTLAEELGRPWKRQAIHLYVLSTLAGQY